MDEVESGDLVTVNEQLQNVLGLFRQEYCCITIATTNVYSRDKPSEPGLNQTQNINKGECFSPFRAF